MPSSAESLARRQSANHRARWNQLNLNPNIKHLIADTQAAVVGDVRAAYQVPYRSALRAGVTVTSASERRTCPRTGGRDWKPHCCAKAAPARCPDRTNGSACATRCGPTRPRRPAQGGFKVCHAPTAEEGLATAHRLWPNEGLPGELAQVLPQPKHFEQASQLVTPDMLSLPTGPDPEPYLQQVKAFADAGFDEVHVAQIGPDQDEFFTFWRDHVAPRLG